MSEWNNSIKDSEFESLKHTCMADVPVSFEEKVESLQTLRMNEMSLKFCTISHNLDLHTTPTDTISMQLVDTKETYKNVVDEKKIKEMKKKKTMKKEDAIEKLLYKYSKTLTPIKVKLSPNENINWENLFFVSDYFIATRSDESDFYEPLFFHKIEKYFNKNICFVKDIRVVCELGGNIKTIIIEFKSFDDLLQNVKAAFSVNKLPELLYRKTETGELKLFAASTENKIEKKKIKIEAFKHKVLHLVFSDHDLTTFDHQISGDFGIQWCKTLFGTVNHAHENEEYLLIFTTSHDALGYVHSSATLPTMNEINKLLRTYTIRHNMIMLHKNIAPNIELSLRAALGSVVSLQDMKVVSDLIVKPTENAGLVFEYKTKDYFNLYKKPARLPLYFDFRSIDFCVGDTLEEKHLVYGYDEDRKRLRTLRARFDRIDTYLDIPSKQKLAKKKSRKVGDIVYLTQDYEELQGLIDQNEKLFNNDELVGEIKDLEDNNDLDENINKIINMLKVVVFVRSSGVLNGKICPQFYTMRYDATWSEEKKTKIDCYYAHELDAYGENILKDFHGSFLRWDVLQWWRQSKKKVEDKFDEMLRMGMSCTDILKLLKYEKVNTDNMEAYLYKHKYGLQNRENIFDIRSHVHNFTDYVHLVGIQDVMTKIEMEAIIKPAARQSLNVGVMCLLLEDMTSNWRRTTDIDGDDEKWFVRVDNVIDDRWNTIYDEKSLIINDNQPIWRYHYGAYGNNENQSFYRLDRCAEEVREKHPLTKSGLEYLPNKFESTTRPIRNKQGWYIVEGTDRKFFSKNILEERVDWRSAVTQAIVVKYGGTLGARDANENIIQALQEVLESNIEANTAKAPNDYFYEDYAAYKLYAPTNDVSKDDFMDMEYKRLKWIYFGFNRIFDAFCNIFHVSLIEEKTIQPLSGGWFVEMDAEGNKSYIRGKERKLIRPLESLLRPEEWVSSKADGRTEYTNLRFNRKKQSSPEDLVGNNDGDVISISAEKILSRESVAGIYDTFHNSIKKSTSSEKLKYIFEFLEQKNYISISEKNNVKTRNEILKKLAELDKTHKTKIDEYKKYIELKEQEQQIDSLFSELIE